MMNRKGFVLIGLCIIFITVGNSVAQTFTNYTINDGLPSNNINGVAIDIDNNTWVATDAGVARYANNIWTTFTVADGLIDNYINCIAVDADNNVWVGTDFGVSRYVNGTWNSFTSGNGLIGDMVSYICGAGNGDVWVGTSSGISRLTSTGWVSYSTSNGLPGNMISYIKDDLFGNVWIGTWLTGLVKFDGTNFTVFTTSQQLVDNNILSLAIDKQKNKWIGTYMGITVLDSLDQWKLNYNHSDGLYNNYIQDLSFDSRSVLWAGIYADYLADGAINYFYQDQWHTIGVPAGLIDVQVKRIALDDYDNVWIATGAGLSKLTVNNLGTVETGKHTFVLYPNPAIKTLFIENQTDNIRINIFDVAGKMVGNQDLPVGSRIIDISDLETGIYMVRIENGNGITSTKFIKQ
ncbi:MAG: two-component regulator propeller domain-containing protein [Bacteroidales bacterium]